MRISPPATPDRRWSRTAFTVVEIAIGVSLMALICVYLADAWINISRSEQAISKKASTARALQYLQGRLRRDIWWARKAEVPGGTGPTLKLKNIEGKTRTYRWESNTDKKALFIPDLVNPEQSIEYNQCKFRFVAFYCTEGGSEGVRIILAPLPSAERADQTSEKEVVWGVAMVGRAQLDSVATSHRYAFFNEFAFPRAP